MRIKSYTIIVLGNHKKKMFWLLNFQNIQDGQCIAFYILFKLFFSFAFFINFSLENSSADVSEDGKYLLITTSETERDNLVFYSDLEKNHHITGKIPLIPIITEMDADYTVIKIKFNFYFS